MEALRGCLNMKVFVDTDDDLRLARRCVKAKWDGMISWLDDQCFTSFSQNQSSLSGLYRHYAGDLHAAALLMASS